MNESANEGRWNPLVRITAAIGVGILFCLLSLLIAWDSTGGNWRIDGRRVETKQVLDRLRRVCGEFREENGRFPNSLEELAVEPQWLLDGWKRPVEYTVTGETVAILSRGLDGAPGGRGLDRDLKDSDEYFGFDFPTFHQFVWECDSEGIVRTCLASGLLAAGLFWFYAKPLERKPQALVRLAVQGAAIALAALFVGGFLAVLHAPTGH